MTIAEAVVVDLQSLGPSHLDSEGNAAISPLSDHTAPVVPASSRPSQPRARRNAPRTAATYASRPQYSGDTDPDVDVTEPEIAQEPIGNPCR